MHDDRRHLAPEPRGCLMFLNIRAVGKGDVDEQAGTVFLWHSGTGSCSVDRRLFRAALLGSQKRVEPKQQNKPPE